MGSNRTVGYLTQEGITYGQVRYLTQDRIKNGKVPVLYLIQDENGAECVGSLHGTYEKN
jgi:hypothetical protein